MILIEYQRSYHDHTHDEEDDGHAHGHSHGAKNDDGHSHRAKDDHGNSHGPQQDHGHQNQDLSHAEASNPDYHLGTEDPLFAEDQDENCMDCLEESILKEKDVFEYDEDFISLTVLCYTTHNVEKYMINPLKRA